MYILHIKVYNKYVNFHTFCLSFTLSSDISVCPHMSNIYVLLCLLQYVLLCLIYYICPPMSNMSYTRTSMATFSSFCLLCPSSYVLFSDFYGNLFSSLPVRPPMSTFYSSILYSSHSSEQHIPPLSPGSSISCLPCIHSTGTHTSRYLQATGVSVSRA